MKVGKMVGWQLLLGMVMMSCCLWSAEVGVEKENAPMKYTVEDTRDLAESLEKLLLPLSEMPESFQIRFEVRADDNFVGSGSLLLQKEQMSFLELYSRNSSCIYFSKDASSTCYIKNADTVTAFKSDQSEKVPVPMLSVLKSTDGNFDFNLYMNAVDPEESLMLSLFFHPDTTAHVVKRLHENFEYAVITDKMATFYADPEQEARAKFIIDDGLITGVELFFPYDDGPDYRVVKTDIIMNSKISEPPTAWLSSSVRVATSTLDSVGSFVTGFYQLLGEMLPSGQ